MRWLVEKVLAAPFIVVALAAGLLGAGLWCYSRLDIEAYPNPVAPMTRGDHPAGRVERGGGGAVRHDPARERARGMIDLEHIRSQSLFGLSDVKCYFNWTPDYHTRAAEGPEPAPVHPAAARAAAAAVSLERHRPRSSATRSRARAIRWPS